MINREEAQAELQKIRVKNWRKIRIDKLKSLPQELAEIGFILLGCDQEGKPLSRLATLESLEYHKTYQQTLEKLNRIESKARLKVFEIIFPKFSRTVEQGWQLFSQLPYQLGYQRKAFRLPNHPDFFSASRCQWLTQLIQVVEGYEQELAWFAIWAPYLSYYAADTLGILFAAAINQENELGKEIFQLLITSAKGEHEIGGMGRHITRALLVSSSVQGWEFMASLLLAAQRQEGLRQVILETIDEAHPEAFKRILRLIIDHDLTRFSAVIRAVNVWFGWEWESINHKLIKPILEQISLFLEDNQARCHALNSAVPQEVYLALWTWGFEDAIAAINYAKNLLNNPQVEIRFVTVYFLGKLGIRESQIALLTALKDGDLRIVTQALFYLNYNSLDQENKAYLFEQLEEILPRFPKKEKQLTPLVWEWIKLKVSQRTVTEVLVNNLGEKSPKYLIPYLSLCQPYTRASIAEKLAKIEPWDQEIRNILFALVGDSSQWVRQRVIESLSNCKISSEEAIYLEKLLTRKSGDLRRGILTIFLNQEDVKVIATIQRLLNSKTILQRQAGLELIQEMRQQQRQIDDCINWAKTYQENQQNLSEIQIQSLNLILEQSREEPTLENALGLVNLHELTLAIPPETKQITILNSRATINCLTSLDKLIDQHRHTPIITENYQGTQEELLGNMNWSFPYPNPQISLEQDLKHFPLREIWENWYQQRLPELKEQDGLELVRAIAISLIGNPDLNQSGLENLASQENESSQLLQLKYPYIVQKILNWLILIFPPQNLFDFLLDAIAISLNNIPCKTIKNNRQKWWLLNDYIAGWLNLIKQLRSYFLSDWQEQHQIRFWQVIQWLNESLGYLYYYNNQLSEIVATYNAKGINKQDIIAYLIIRKSGDEQNNHFSNQWYNFSDLSLITRKKNNELDPILMEISHQIRQRILEIELNRGDLPTPASSLALALASVEGIDIIIKLLQKLGKNTLIRGYTYDNLSQGAVFSHLIRVSFPAATETPQEFATKVKSAAINQERLIELAFYAPQWSEYVEEAIAWPKFTEAVWWIHAHTKDNNWQVPTEIRETWVAQISEKTPLSAQNLLDGAVDVEWFKGIYRELQAEKWQKIMNAAKYASSSSGHKRSQLFAQAILGDINKETLIKRIQEKRHQDALRGLGLLPLETQKNREEDLMSRYLIIQEFVHNSRQFGSQRQASEKLAATIALENLSRTAGYPDPQRLEWAMEARNMADLVKKPQNITIESVKVSLSILEGQPIITVEKQGKTLKSIPAKLGKNPEIKALKTRKKQIESQISRMRVSLESAMCRGDNFTPTELQQLYQNPLLSPILSQLVLIGEEEIGYPVADGEALQKFNGEIQEIKSSSLKIAHSYDLFSTKEWHLWQQECFSKQRKQPFKQIFRELYLLTSREKATSTFSNRYEGHQVNPRQALALLGKRGWITYPEEGVRKTFHQEGISVWVSFLEGFYTPVEVEGLTIQRIYFTKRGEWKALKLEEIPPYLFSEVMRDLDLIVSVAHQGGVNPEASLSTVEMRSALARETCHLLRLDNVRLENYHILIEGKLGSYSLHLGSGIVHRQPGGELCIIPVHSQHRGRLFLPFADDDPKTAEIISKMLLLAKDKDIKDPTILEQIL